VDHPQGRVRQRDARAAVKAPRLDGIQNSSPRPGHGGHQYVPKWTKSFIPGRGLEKFVVAGETKVSVSRLQQFVPTCLAESLPIGTAARSVFHQGQTVEYLDTTNIQRFQSVARLEQRLSSISPFAAGAGLRAFEKERMAADRDTVVFPDCQHMKEFRP
jgi:hypothetical protein